MTIPVVTNPSGTVVVWIDNDGRHDTRTGTDIVTPLTRDEASQVLRAQLTAGIAAFQSAADAAAADVVTAQAMQSNAGTYQAAAQALANTAFTAASTYSRTQIQALADAVKATASRQAVLFAALAALLGWRVQVDQNAVATDQALIWLGRLADHTVL